VFDVDEMAEVLRFRVDSEYLVGVWLSEKVVVVLQELELFFL